MNIKKLIQLLENRDSTAKIVSCYTSPYEDSFSLTFSDGTRLEVLYGQTMRERNSVLYGGNRKCKRVAKK